MRKLVAVLCVVLLFPVFLTSCGSASSTQESRVELTKRGKVIEYTVEDFSASNYDINELNDFVEEEIDAYKEENKGRIRVRTEREKNGIVYLTIQYNKPEIYAKFNDVACFAGTVSEAREAGYDFSMDFTMPVEEEESEESLAEGEAAPRITVPGSTVTEDESQKVFIIETDADVTVPGEVLYSWCSEGETSWLSMDTVDVEAEESDLGDGNLVYVVYE